jgi:ribonuclease HII
MRESPRRRRARQLTPVDPSPTDLSIHEKALHAEGFRVLAGVDEAGRGCLAGPVVAAAVILPPACDLPGLNDSKQLSKKERDRFYDAIRASARAVAVGAVDAGEIDRINILEAALKAMRIAVEELCVKPECLLIDGPFEIDHLLPQRAITKGDARSFTIAAASVIAKVTRDRMMVELEKIYPAFSFSVHKGYGTARHLEELSRHGPTPIHRLTFRRVGL